MRLQLDEGKKRRQRAADGASERPKKVRYVQSRDAIPKEARVCDRLLLYLNVRYHAYVWKCDEVMNNSQTRGPTDILDVCGQIGTCTDNGEGSFNLSKTLNRDIKGDEWQ